LTFIRKYKTAIVWVAFGFFIAGLFFNQARTLSELEANSKADAMRNYEQTLANCRLGNDRSRILIDIVDFASKPTEPGTANEVQDPKVRQLVEDGARRNQAFRDFAFGTDPATGRARIPVRDCEKEIIKPIEGK